MACHRAHGARAASGVPPARLLDGYVGTLVVRALDDLGVLEQLDRDAPLPLESLVERARLDVPKLRALLRVMEFLGYVDRDDRGAFALTRAGHALRDESGYFLVTARGFAPVLAGLGAMTDGTAADRGPESLRDDAATALGCARIHASRRAPILRDVVAGIEYRGVLDIGCGDGSRLVELVSAGPDVVGVGIDISPDACGLARGNLDRHGLGDRVVVIEGDALEVLASPPVELRDGRMDLATCSFLMHHWFDVPGGAGGALSTLRAALPGLRHLLVADHLRPPDPGDVDGLPIFALGFELFHAFIGVALRREVDYRAAFADAGLELVECLEFGHAQEFLFHATPASRG